LLIIHPFMDANVRLARAVIHLFLYELGKISSPRFYLSAYFKRRRLEYFEKLYLISVAKDWEGWICFFLQGVVEEGEKIIRQCRRCRSFSSSS
ncbi:MAG TPA: cell filamentation protein Fic, partial [Parachlamydiales bacterium]|nr:cell filamentation protein Fic [Parachlamydiales bacterium]